MQHAGQFWLQFLAQVYFGMQTGGAWYQTATPAISVKLALPAESQPPSFRKGQGGVSSGWRLKPAKMKTFKLTSLFLGEGVQM